MKGTSNRWSDDQLIVLLAFYFRRPRAEHTDSHPRCIQLANAIGRTPGAADNQMRNIDYDLVRTAGDRHCSVRLGQLLNLHRSNLTALYREANRVVRRTGWTLPRF